MATKKETVLVTRFCREGMKSDWNPKFEWPTEGPVSCPDWDPTPMCGGGLHGWLWGKGESRAWGYRDTDVMLVVEVLKEDLVSLDGGSKVKFPKGVVVHCGDRASVTQYMAERGIVGILHGIMTVGDGETAEVGELGIARAGKGGTAIADDGGRAVAGDFGHAEAGPRGVAVAGDNGLASVSGYGKATAGKGGTARAGYRGSAIAGFRGTALAGHYGVAEAGHEGIAETGEFGVAKVGDGGTATAMNLGYAQAGKGGQIRIGYCDPRPRTAVGYIGENGIEPDVLYGVNSEGEFFRYKVA